MKMGTMLLLSGAGLFGCTSTMPDNLGVSGLSYISSEVCCQSVADFPWIKLQKDETITFEINESSPVWIFNKNKVYFAAFEFAKQSGMVEILARSNMLDGKALAPNIDLYDSAFNLVKTVGQEEFDIKHSDAFARNRYEIKLSIDSVNTPYMVIYGDSDQNGEKVVVPHPAKVRAEKSGEPLPIVTDPSYTITPTGHLTLGVKTLTLTGSKRSENNPLEASKAEVVQSKSLPTIKVTTTTRDFYFAAIRESVTKNDINKALALLEEAKILGINGAQDVFVNAVNSK